MTHEFVKDPIDCVFRTQREGTDFTETASCLLLAQILGTSADHCVVTRPICHACLQHSRDSNFADHPVFPSLVFHHATHQLACAEDAKTQDHWAAWVQRAEAVLLLHNQPEYDTRHIPSCDVIMCAFEDGPELRTAIESVLNQYEAAPTLHLIDMAESPLDLGDYAQIWNVQLHRIAVPVSPLRAAAHIASSLRTPFIGLHSPQAISDPQRLSRSIQALRDTGAEMFVALGPQPAALPIPETIPNDNLQWVIPSSLVFRRSTLVDLEPSESAHADSEAECLAQAFREGRHIIVSPEPVVTQDTSQTRRPLGSCDDRFSVRIDTSPVTPRPQQAGPTRQCRFPVVPVRCDVVLPFLGQLHFVRAALESLLAQEQSTPIIHLIDDATPGDTSDFLDEWAQHPQLRVYRNRENIGQFQSFNNVAPYWETELVAVQDADDISLPHRLHWAGQMLHWSGADYFAGAVETFGDDAVIRSGTLASPQLVRSRRPDFRRSVYPPYAQASYFAENPTAVFRTAMFRDMGGYADFGSRLINRTSLDTEFQLRCWYRGVRFAISQEVVTRYRVHPASATQDQQSGWGSAARTESGLQLEARCRVYRTGSFDPRSFGALGRYTHLTERWWRSR